MQNRPSVIERAFEIAKSGTVADLTALRLQLAAENYSNGAQALAGRSVANQLARRIQAARIKKSAVGAR